MGERFSLARVIAERELEPFVFDGPDGAEMELPHVSTLTPRQALRVDRGEIEEVLEEVAPAVAAVILDSPSFAAEALMSAWLTHGGIEPGESPASPRSSKSTAGPSKRTSRRTTR